MKPLNPSALIGVEQNESIYSSGWRPGLGGTVAVLEKATGAHLATVGLASAKDVERASLLARDAQVAWSETPGPLRADVVRKFAALVEAHTEELATWIVRETGSITPKAHFEIGTTVREAVETAALASMHQGHILATTARRPSYAKRVPIGVVGVITPWNSPFVLAARAILPALVLGNAVLLKPDPQTPICGGHVLARLLEEAGLPDGLFHVLPGGADTGEALVADPLVGMISFTGSTQVGRRIGEVAGRMLKRVALELGGNNALIVFDDADLERATSAAAFGSFFHQGQICFTAGRHLVHTSIADRYTDMLTTRARALAIGDPHKQPVHLGPMINLKQVERAQGLLDQSVKHGARIESGGGSNGLFFEPTVVSGVTPDMPVFTEEIFAPVAPITVFHTDEEAIRLANKSEYGLVASIFTRNHARAMRVASRLNTGIVHVNDQTVVHEVFGAIGGVGASGNGARSGNVTSLDEYTRWQWLTIAEEVPEYPF